MPHYHLAIIDDDASHTECLCTQLNTYARASGITFTLRVLHTASDFLDAVMKEAFALCIVSMDMTACNICYFSDQLYKMKLSIPMILTSSDTNRAYDAFRNGASGFLLLPVCYEDLAELLNRLLPYLYARMTIPDSTNSIMVRRDGNPFYILTRDIYYFEKYRNKLYIYTENSCYHIYDTIRALRRQLNPKQFLQINQGCLVNWAHVNAVSRESIRVGCYALPVSQTYYKAVLFQLRMYPLDQALVSSYQPAATDIQVAQPDTPLLPKTHPSPAQSPPDPLLKAADSPSSPIHPA